VTDLVGILKGDPISKVAEIVGRGSGVALQTLGFLLVLAVVTSSFHIDLHGSEFAVAFAFSVLLVLAGAAVSLYEYKRRQDVFETKANAAVRMIEASLNATQARLTAGQTLDVTALDKLLETIGEWGKTPAPAGAGVSSGGQPSS
jgi:hypothetical protein